MKKTKNLILSLLLTLPILLSAQQTVHIGDILCTDGSTISVSEFPSSGKTAMGVVYYLDPSGLNGLAVNLYDDATDIQYGGYGVDFPITDIEESRKAIYDFDGYSNTEALRGMYGGSYYYPAAWCTDFDNGWYIPAAGELRLIYNHILTVNNSLTAVGGTALFANTNNYWSSTERTPYHMHDMNRTGNLGNYTKTMASNPAILGVRSIRSFTTNTTSTPIGELIVNEDGSKGIVFYVNPDEKAYWMVALNDAPSTYTWGDHSDSPLNNHDPEITFNLLNDNNGLGNTETLIDYQSGNSYAAAQVDFENGWYLPSAGQLSKLYGVLPLIENSISMAGGSLMTAAPYWTSTECDEDNAWWVDYGSTVYYGGYYQKKDKATYAHVRAIRNFDPETLQPLVDDIITPEAICAGNSLDLQTPSTQFASSQGWQIASDEDFTNGQAYNGEALDESYDGWYLRYFASNHLGTVYSNTVQISVLHVSASSFDISNCGPYIWNNETYTESGTYQQYFPMPNGCDSVATMHLTINSPTNYEFQINTCESYTWNGTNYTESGDFIQTFMAQTGCDSIVTLHLTINSSTNYDFSINTCDSYIWNNTEYTESGDFTQTFTASTGCDSIVTLHLTIVPPISYEFTISTCNSYIWNSTEYAESGDYTQTLQTSLGCDSIVTLHLTIDTFEEMQAIEGDVEVDSYLTPSSVYNQPGFMSGSTYQWTIEPAEAGTLTPNGGFVLVNWSPEFIGTATLKVIVSNACGEGENAINVNVKSTFDVKENIINAKIYPNPTSGIVNIEIAGMQRITVTNTLGQMVIDKELDANSTSLDIAQFGKGLFVICIQTKEGSCTRRIEVK